MRGTSVNAAFEPGTHQLASVEWNDLGAAPSLVSVEVLERHANGAPRAIARSAGGHFVKITSEVDGLGSTFASEVLVSPDGEPSLETWLDTLSTQDGDMVRHTTTTVDDGALGWRPFGGPVYDALGRLQTWQSNDAALAQAYVATMATRESVTVPDGFAPVVRAAQIDPYGLRTRMVQVSVAGEPLAMDARVLDTMGRVALQAIGTAPTDGPGPPQLIVRAPSYDLAGRIGSVAELETTSPAVLGEVNPTVAVRAGLNLEHVVADEVGALARTVERTDLGAPETETTDGTTSWAAVRAANTETPSSVNGEPLEWDAWGRLLSWNRLVDIEWDAAGELFSVGIDDDADGDADGSETYIRDPAGRALLILREWPDGHTERVQQIFDGLNLIEERTADGWRRRHLGGTGALDSSRAYTLDCSLADSMGGDCDDPPRSFGASAVFLTDEEPTATFVLARSLNGDVIAVIDPTDGTVVESYAYGLHGELTFRSRGAADCDAEADAECYGRFGNAFFYTGAPRSPLTGLYDRRARQYSAALRMWISPDPMGFVDGWDRWMYVGGDPVNFVDPLGWGSTGNLVGGAPTPHADPPPAFGFGHLFDHPRDDWNLFREELTSSASRVGDSLAGVGGGVLACALDPLACVGGIATGIGETYNTDGTMAALGEATGITAAGEMLGEGIGGIVAYGNGDIDEDGLQDAILTTTGGAVGAVALAGALATAGRLGADFVTALDDIAAGRPRNNVRNPRPFENDGRGNSSVLPSTDGTGNAISYTEHTVNPRPAGGALDGRRIVTGSDGSVWATADHFTSWTRLQ